MKNKNSTLMLVEAGLVIALAFILGKFLKIYEMPQGGSVTLGSMLPIIIFSVRWGIAPGMFAGFALGLVKIILGGYIVSLAQVALDYLIAFAVIGLSGLTVSKNKVSLLSYIPSILLAFVLRFFSHVLSGMFFFEVDFIGSALYNSFLLPDFLICLVLLAILWKPLQRVINQNK